MEDAAPMGEEEGEVLSVVSRAFPGLREDRTERHKLFCGSSPPSTEGAPS